MGLILPPHIARQRAQKLHLERWARDLLWQHYPFHLFIVSFNEHEFSWRIDHMLMGKTGACMYIAPDVEDVQGELVRRAGEILERANLPRRGLESYQQYDDVKATAKEAFSCR